MTTELAADRTRGLRWARLDNARLGEERKLYRVTRALFRDYEQEVLRRLSREENLSASRRLFDAGMLERLTQAAFNVTAWHEALRETGQGTLLKPVSFVLPGDTGDRVDGEELLEVNDQWIRAHVTNTVRSVKGTQVAALESIVADAFATEGVTTEQLTREIRSHFAGMKTWEARRIAQTESTAFWNRGSDQAIAMAGVAEKQWMSARDDRVRATHVAADGQTVPVGGNFTVGNATGPHPGALSEAGENINCRCVEVAAV